MKTLSTLLLLAAMLGCDPQQSGTQVNNTIPAGPGGPATAPVDPPLPGAKISLTRNFYFVFDDSGSMSANYGNSTRIQSAKTAAETFAKNAPIDANLGLCYLNLGETVALGPNTRNAFIKSVREATTRGGTPLGQWIRHGVERLVHQRKMQLGYGEFRLVVVTDGEADSSSDMEDAVRYAARMKIPIYTIGVATGRHSLADSSLSFTEAKNPEQLKTALLETLAEANSFDSTDFHK